MKQRTTAVILVIALLVGTLFGCITALEAGSGIRLSDIRRIDVISGSIGVATDQHYYRMYLSGDVTQPIKIEQLD
jgi:hypothetical protein